MSGRLNLSLSGAWRDRFITADEVAAIEARIPDDHYLYVVNETRRAGAWRLELHREGVHGQPVWIERIGRTLVGACHRALTIHEDGAIAATTDASGHLTSLDGAA